jgi:hypothetical protein
MESEQFWRELESQFSSLASRPGAGYLHAVFDNTSPAEVKELVEAAGEWANGAIHDASAEAVDAAYHHARRAAQGAAAILDGWYVRGYWRVSGGPSDELARRVLHADFRCLAARGATAADAVTPNSTPEQAEQSADADKPAPEPPAEAPVARPEVTPNLLNQKGGYWQARCLPPSTPVLLTQRHRATNARLERPAASSRICSINCAPNEQRAEQGPHRCGPGYFLIRPVRLRLALPPAPRPHTGLSSTAV